ncbi:MAG: hypothetical protein ACFE7E_03885 [Candidatus Hodarchaeota archaeon]
MQKRMRLRQKSEVKTGEAVLNTKILKEIKVDVNNSIEIVVNKKRFSFNALSNLDVPNNEVWLNTDEMKKNGHSDKTIATIRKPIESP